MGILDELGVGGTVSNMLPGQGAVMWIGIVFICVVVLIFAGGITFAVSMKKLKKKSYKNQIPIFQTINGKRTRIGLDWAKEMFVPDTNISLYYLKSYKIYLARPTRAMGKDEYWYSISENGEWVNFDLSVDPDNDTLAKANYDHRDTRYAYINLKDIIKKNYKDKALLWWKDPIIMGIIGIIIVAIVYGLLFWFLTARMGNLIGQMGPFLDKMDIIADKMSQGVLNAQSINSGVTPA